MDKLPSKKTITNCFLKDYDDIGINKLEKMYNILSKALLEMVNRNNKYIEFNTTFGIGFFIQNIKFYKELINAELSKRYVTEM